MLKKCVCWICVVCAASVMGLPVRAKQTGSIRVTPMWGGVPIAGGTVSVCYVGQKTQDGVQFTDGLANWMVSETEVYSADWLNWLSAKAADRQVCQPVMKGQCFLGCLRVFIWCSSIKRQRALLRFHHFCCVCRKMEAGTFLHPPG